MSVQPDYVGADFAAAEFEQRATRVRAVLRERGLGALVTTGAEDIYYLLGLNFQGYSSFSLLVLPAIGPLILVARTMERHTIQYQAPDVKHVGYGDDEDPARAVLAAVAETSGDIGVDRRAMSLPVDIWERVAAGSGHRVWRDGSGLLPAVRAVKSPAEIAHVRAAAAISDAAVAAGVAATRAGVSERSVAAAIHHELVERGSEYPGFAPFVRGTDILHHEHITWQDRPVRSGQGLLFELSASVYRYHAPLTRMVYADRLPPGVAAAAATALAGLDAITRALRPGVLSGDVYTAWEDTVGGPGRHHCGYLIGVAFPPSWFGGSGITGLRDGSALTVAEGMVFHVMSWILGENAGQYCLSDTALVTATGCELLTRAPREPVVRQAG
ncbi:M24 family metallopeptidase [Actinophytocola algeriensis]|uniref:Xaa-Pro dipeptidase n=1 Tax=Actinophytocola algeriensis TaxID=1768010 RepID=A0A7W7VDH3_9PSEU|nr:Xaa-Pro peptidase family protein [Actinophytocola algeriensis]MBB4906181.1 Xaa-Pro dipeptidase [Actinophytocola algeriensis]MBE1472134.1 Xaa-Pro dipeptidase [Actinophytocola algeriensis]